MGDIIVLGIGNRLMMDDGVGIYLVEDLSKQDVKPNIRYLIGESDIDYCLDQIKNATFVIILDAVFSGTEPGEVSVYPVTALNECQSLDISPHNLHLFQALQPRKQTIKGFLVGVEPDEISFHIGLSKILKEKKHSILQNVRKTIEKLLNEAFRSPDEKINLKSFKENPF
ncbi:hydrogenase maturation protease [Terrilactibacillus sp. S3-3]|nr:hydrogenase maturation protease [Terrilactibacillus sp. S3-3]